MRPDPVELARPAPDRGLAAARPGSSERGRRGSRSRPARSRRTRTSARPAPGDSDGRRRLVRSAFRPPHAPGRPATSAPPRAPPRRRPDRGPLAPRGRPPVPPVVRARTAGSSSAHSSSATYGGLETARSTRPASAAGSASHHDPRRRTEPLASPRVQAPTRARFAVATVERTRLRRRWPTPAAGRTGPDLDRDRQGDGARAGAQVRPPRVDSGRRATRAELVEGDAHDLLRSRDGG